MYLPTYMCIDMHTYMHMYVCMHVCNICMYVHIYISTSCLDLWINTYTDICIHIQTPVYLLIYIPKQNTHIAYKHTNMCSYIYSLITTYLCNMCIYVHTTYIPMHVYVHIHIYTCIFMHECNMCMYVYVNMSAYIQTYLCLPIYIPTCKH